MHRLLDYRVHLRHSLLALVALMAAFLALQAPAEAGKLKCSSSLQWKPNVPPRCEQSRYARETARLAYTDFLTRKQDFVIHGCETPNNPSCTKPAPYNAFDWTTDGCSGPTPPDWKAIFDGPCQQHDFGYRNFGHGLELRRSELQRLYIDRRFRDEMRRICQSWGASLQTAACFKVAKTMYQAVRVAQDGQPGGWGL